jgi:hypothetical protein
MALLKGSLGLAVLVVLARPVALWPADAEPALEVDLAPQATATATPAPPTPTAVPTEVPTQVPTAVPTQALTPAPTALPQASSSTAKPGDLGEVNFDKSQAPEAEDGLMIIAPGAATAEDSLESFGIDSPFNWKSSKERATLQPGKAAEGEDSLELEAPESSDLKEQVRVETGEGTELPTDADYDQVERAGLVLGPSEYRVDGRLDRTKDGQIFAQSGTQVALRMEPGRQVYPGSIYTVFRESGTVTRSSDQQEIGLLIRNVGVLKVVRIEGEEVLARVEKQYETIREGDLVRLRDPDRLRYYNSVRQGQANVPLDLQGEVVALPPLQLMANTGDVVYLDLGRAQGLAPGSKLTLYRVPEELGPDDVRELKVTGRMGQVVVVNVSHDSCVAKIVHATEDVRIGDKVRFR